MAGIPWCPCLRPPGPSPQLPEPCASWGGEGRSGSWGPGAQSAGGYVLLGPQVAWKKPEFVADM